MYIYLSLFFISLFTITFMVMRRVVLLKEAKIHPGTELMLDVPDLEEIKIIAANKFRIYGYVMLVGSIRLYVKSSHLLKNKYKATKETVKHLHRKYISKSSAEVKTKEASKFLKMMGDYKKKVTAIKKKIKEEEGLN